MLSQNVLNFLKNVIAIFLGRLSPRIFSFIFVIYIARFLGSTDFGKFALALGYFDLFLALNSRGLNITVTREIAKHPSNQNEYISISITLGLILSVISNIILITIALFFPYSQDTRFALYQVCIALIPSTIATIFEGAFVGIQKAEYITYGTVIENILRTGIWFIAILCGYSLILLFSILIFSRTFLMFFYALIYHFRVSKFIFKIKHKPFKNFLLCWKIIAIENWVSTFIGSLDIIFLSIFSGEKMVGLYSAAAKFLNIADIGASSYIVALFPYISRLYNESKLDFKKIVEGSFKYMLYLIVPCTMLLAVTGDKLIIFLYGNDYADTIPIFSVLIWALIFRVFNPFLSHVLFARGAQEKSLKVALICLIVYTPTVILFIRSWQGVGAASAILAVSTMAFFIFFKYVWHEFGVLQGFLISVRPFFACIVLGILLFSLKSLDLFTSVILSFSVYFLLTLYFERSLYRKF